MSHTLHIFISDDNTGDTVLGLKETCPESGKTTPPSFQKLLEEPFLIKRLWDDSKLSEKVRGEMVTYRHPRYRI